MTLGSRVRPSVTPEGSDPPAGQAAGPHPMLHLHGNWPARYSSNFEQ